jgi:hypothetical protein
MKAKEKLASVLKHEIIKTNGGEEVKLHAHLISALYECEFSASRFGRFTLGTHCKGGWVGSQSRLDVVVKISTPAGNHGTFQCSVKQIKTAEKGQWFGWFIFLIN